MRPRSALSTALMFGLIASTALAQAPPPPKPPGISVVQPAGDVCPPGGTYITDAYAPKPLTPDQTRAPRIKTSAGAFKVQTVVAGLDHPRSLAFLPDGRILLAEGRDHLRIVDKAGKISAPLAGTPAIAKGFVTGIMDVVADPGFARNRVFYFTYTVNKPGAVAPAPNTPIPTEGRIMKARLSAKGDAVEDQTAIYLGSALRRLLLLPDGTIMVTTISGDGKTAQTLTEDGGKVLRFNKDGSAPKDNPFASRADVGRFAYTLGQRDPDGLARDARGRVWTVEHGPRGGDELNQIKSGLNYGYALVSYGRQYSDAPINNDVTTGPGLEQPVYYWTPDVAPSGLMAYSGAMFPAWKGDIFVGGLVAESLIRLQMKNGRVMGEEFMLADRCQRIRDIRQAPDGAIYLLTDADNGELLRISKG
jgi:glucose/arabinose dehydrogenase